MQQTYEFLKKCGAYFIATVDGEGPQVRPFGTVNIFEGRLYIQTGKIKPVSKQMHANPKIAISAMGDGKVIRITATAVPDPRVAAEQSMLDAYPGLQGKYRAGDGNNEVWYLTDAVSTITSMRDAELAVETF